MSNLENFISGQKTHYHAWWNAAAQTPCARTLSCTSIQSLDELDLFAAAPSGTLMVHDTPLLKTFSISLPFQRFCKNSIALSYDINSRCCSLRRSYRKCYNSSAWVFLRKSLSQLHFWAHHWTLSNHHSVQESPFLIGYVQKHDAASNH